MSGGNSDGGTEPPHRFAGPSFSTAPITKVDILFDVDNSSSMGDKQQYLQQAIPDLIARLVTPNCVDSNGNGLLDGSGNQITSDANGNCAPDANGVVGQPQFPPVQDMHIGILTSSLGGRGTTSICQTPSTPGAVPADYLEYTSGSPAYVDPFEDVTSIPKNNDDQAHLINRSDPPSTPNAATTPSPYVTSSNFLDWFPSQPVGGLASPPTLVSAFQDIVVGAQAYGCGIESQLESWYRFLVQPDPYESITTTKNGEGLLVASWSGVDTTILQQRHDFLRPDSLVLIVVLSDENDSEVDVRTIGGIGVNWLDNNFQPPRGTSECASSPGSSQCTSCAFSNAPQGDAQCMTENGVYAASDPPNWGFNDNLRHVHMKQKYGVDVQFPIQRYWLGLTSQKVPDRSGEYPSGAQYYQGLTNLNCQNPLFSTNLPTTTTGPGDPALCNLMPDTVRTPSSNLVYYAHIGGVPHELLTTQVNGQTVAKETLTASDWTAILGNDPLNFDYSGIDPHMVESYAPRTGLPVQGSGATVVDDEAPDWVTDGTTPQRVNLPVDREYACVFKLATPRNCDSNNASNSEADISSCDCSTSGLAANAIPPVCDTENPLQQDYAKAYPTIRELLLARLMGTQGIVSSLCPIDVTDNAAGNDPLYGYRPAVGAIIDRLKVSLTAPCLPEPLTVNDAGAVPCLMLVTLPDVTSASACTDAAEYPGLQPVDPTVLAKYRAEQHAAYVQGATAQDLSTFTTCQIQQLTSPQYAPATSCGSLAGPVQGWCYVSNQGQCAQQVVFSPDAVPPGGVLAQTCPLGVPPG